MRYTYNFLINTLVILFYISVPFTLLSMYERANYPKVLFSKPQSLKKLTEKDMMDLHFKCQKSLELTKLDGKVYIRCGTFWPKIKTYVVDEKNAPWVFENKQKNDQEAFVI